MTRPRLLSLLSDSEVELYEAIGGDVGEVMRAKRGDRIYVRNVDKACADNRLMVIGDENDNCGQQNYH